MPKIIYEHIRKANILDKITDNAREIAKKCARQFLIFVLKSGKMVWYWDVAKW